jgi:hypothetical protein
LNEFLNSVEDLVDLQGVVDAVPEQWEVFHVSALVI